MKARYGNVLWRRSQGADPAEGQDVVLAQALHLAEEARAASAACGARLLGLGLATPGTVNVEEGLLIFFPNLQWRNVPFRRIFQERTGLPVWVDNDANAAALGEHFFGVARHAQDFIFIFAGVGVAGAYSSAENSTAAQAALPGRLATPTSCWKPTALLVAVATAAAGRPSPTSTRSSSGFTPGWLCAGIACSPS